MRVFDALEVEGGADCVRFVGGCVRNLITGREIKDVDLATHLKPDKVLTALELRQIKTIPTGLTHGTVAASLNGQILEITTLRKDIETDGRHARVAFSQNWTEDAQRRDFTVNALYMDRLGRIHDPLGSGIADLKQGHVRFIGDSRQRILEDYLRILRFFRFSSDFSDGFDADGVQACQDLAEGIRTLSGERIWSEWKRILGSLKAENAMSVMEQSGVMAIILKSEISDRTPERKEAFKRTCTLFSDVYLRLMVWLHGCDRLNAGSIRVLTKCLKWSRRESDRMIQAANAMAQGADLNRRAQEKCAYRFGRQALLDSMSIYMCIYNNEIGLSLQALEAVKKMNIPVFPLRGSHLVQIGFQPGREMGQKLKMLENQWIESGFDDAILKPFLQNEGK